MGFFEKEEDNKTTISPKASTTKPKDPPQGDYFKSERERYKAERVAHRQEGAKQRFKEFGSSSSEEDDIPIKKSQAKILLTQPKL